MGSSRPRSRQQGEMDDSEQVPELPGGVAALRGQAKLSPRSGGLEKNWDTKHVSQKFQDFQVRGMRICIFWA